MSVIHWFRREARLSNNTALNAAIREGGGVVIAESYSRAHSPVRQSQYEGATGDDRPKHAPQLAHVPQRYLYASWLTPAEVQRRSGCIIGGDYPMPIVDHDVQKDQIVRRFKGGRP